MTDARRSGRANTARPPFDIDVFLSHNRAEKDWVRTLARRIESEDWRGRPLRVFFDEWDIRPGQSIPRMLEEALPRSRKVLVVLSPQAVASGWVELERFVTLCADPAAKQERLIPILRRDCDIPALLTPLKHLDFRDDDAFEERYRTLVCLLRDEPLPRASPKTPSAPGPVPSRRARAGLAPPLPDELAATLRGNPFYCGGMIRPPFPFVGRVRELRLITERASQGLSSTAVFGERRLGKSSLLYEAARRLNQSAASRDRYRAVYLDGQHDGCRTVTDLLASAALALLADLRVSRSESGRRLKAAREALASGDRLDAAGFGDVLSALRAERIRPLLLLDEFEKLVGDRTNFGDDFFDRLRAFANRGDLGLVTATRTPLRELFPKERPVSNFPNLFVSKRLGELTEAEAKELVACQSSHLLSESERDLALRLAGRHPLRLQAVCSEIYRMKDEGVAATEDAVRDRYRDVLAGWGEEVEQP